MATILGLLLVVTFIANYISTTLPNQMGQNDLQHEVVVENQVAQLSALLQLTAAQGAVGAPISQGITLGSAGAPPFAGQDPSTITPLANHSGYSVAFTLSGASTPSLPVSYSTWTSSCTQGYCAGTGFLVTLHNTYVTGAQVALEQGAVVYAQQDSIPVFIVPPSISLTNNVLSIFLPRFSTAVTTEAGVGTADLRLSVLSTSDITFPANGYSLATGSTVTATIVTPFAAGWYAYFQTVKTLAADVSCSPASVCTGLYNAGGPLGTVTLTVPASGLTLNLVTGLYSFSLQ